MLKLLNLGLELDFRTMKKKGILFFLLFTSFVIFSQNEITRYSNIQANLFYGVLIEHDKSLDNAIQGNPYGFLVSWNKINDKTSKFNSLYNYPERGYSFLYENFNSNILGEAYGIYRHFTYNLPPSHKNHLKLTTAFGLGYTTKTYDAIDNPQNFAFGSKLLATAYFKFQYIAFFKDQNLSLNSAINLIHFSNTGFKNPNLGMNTLAINVGVNYKLAPVQIIKKDSLFSIDKSLKYHLILRGGYNESKIIGSGLYPFFTISLNLSKTINNYSRLTTGLDYFNSQFLKEYSKYINIKENKNYPENNSHRVGLFVGHELTQNNFSFVTQIGFYAYYPVPYESRIYERFGFHYKLGKHWLAELTMKVNLFRAEALEFGIGYTL